MPLHDYTTGNVIGKGTYGEVSLVKHKKDRKQYVIKRVDIHNASEREQKAAEQEAKLLSQVRHPNIVSYKESFQGDDGFLYIVMAFCEGGDMYSRLKAQKGIYLEERQIVEWFVQIAMALQYLHDRHILHRDLKTQNIFLTKSKIIKVGDLGIARVLENASDMATTLIGTPYYMSPELFSNKPYSYKSDVWALGCCLYEMCTLKHAFNAKDMNSLVYKILKGKLPTMPKPYSDDLCDIIRSMLGQDPEKRPSVARLLRHSFIKKQIALFLEGTKNRQKKNMKIKESQEPSKTSEKSSKTSDSGYSGMDSREDPRSVESAHSKRTGNEDIEQRLKAAKRDMNSIESGAKKEEKGLLVANDQKAPYRRVTSEERRAKEEIKNSKSEKRSQDGRKSQEGRKTEDNGRAESFDCQHKTRPLPPKPPSRNIVDSSNNVQTKVSRERRRYKVSKQTEYRELAESPANSKESVGNDELKPKVSSGNPVSARERRRQRERESMSKGQSVLPSSMRSDSPMPGERKGSSVDVDVTDGPPVEIPLMEKKPQKRKENYGEGVEDRSSDDSDTEENSQEDALEIKKKPRRKESNDVNSLISALDTTLKFSEQRRSPELDQETQEDQTHDPGDISVSTGRLRDRIEFLRRDCIAGLGKADFEEACSIIDNQSEESVERALVELMGRAKFEKYGGKIWQLKFCETFKRS